MYVIYQIGVVSEKFQIFTIMPVNSAAEQDEKAFCETKRNCKILKIYVSATNLKLQVRSMDFLSFRI